MKDVELKARFAELLRKELSSKGHLTLVGLGRIEVRQRKARKALNPRTRETLDIPARPMLGIRTSPHFIEDLVTKGA